MDATRRGAVQPIITWQAQLAVRLFGLAPATFVRASMLVARLLPSPTGDDGDRRATGAGQQLTVPLLESRSRAAREEAQPSDDA